MTAKYDRVGVGYDEYRRVDPRLLSKIVQYLGLPNPAEGAVLDVGCGTGNYTIALAEQGYQMVGCDPSLRMIRAARDKSDQIDWLHDDAESIRPPSGSEFERVLATLTIHHWNDRVAAFKNLRQVLNSDGELLIFTSTPEQMRNYWLNEYFPRMMEASIEQMPSLSQIRSECEGTFEVSFVEPYAIPEDHQDCFLYCGKTRPELYLNPDIRRGISSFSDLAFANELEVGLSRLADDMESGQINDVMVRYFTDQGDYLFVGFRPI